MTDYSQLDTATLEMLKEVMEDGFAELIDTFVNDFGTRLATLVHAVEHGDCDTVRREAHSMKGSSGNLGATGLATLLLEIENKGRDCDLTGVEELMVFVDKAYREVSASLLGMVQ